MRGTGKTKAMVMALPEGGAFIVAHSFQMDRYIERMIFDLRGRDFFKLCHVHAVHGQMCTNRLHGLRIPIFVDHAFWMMCPSRAAVDAVEIMVDRNERARRAVAA